MKSQSNYNETAHHRQEKIEKQRDYDLDEALKEYHENVTDPQNRRDNKKEAK